VIPPGLYDIFDGGLFPIIDRLRRFTDFLLTFDIPARLDRILRLDWTGLSTFTSTDYIGKWMLDVGLQMVGRVSRPEQHAEDNILHK
jgi:hypothetical protein